MFVTAVPEISFKWQIQNDSSGAVRLGPEPFLVPGFWEHFFDGDAEAIQTFEEEFLNYREGPNF
ncbi:hypothetical protein [Mycobacterium camsae]|uniref:hypothetical protein n=1 Tax=Mycobacterium gordonae TaxID=1778 RepID=UPI001980B08A|nr:hypothetical protein [Mycobacterium gordonae]